MLYLAKHFETALFELCTITDALWLLPVSCPDGHHSFGNSCWIFLPPFTISAAEMHHSLPCSIRIVMRSPSNWERHWSPALRGWCIPANVIRAASVRLFSTRITRLHPFRGDIDYHWDGEKVDLYRVSGTTEVWRVRIAANRPPGSLNCCPSLKIVPPARETHRWTSLSLYQAFGSD